MRVLRMFGTNEMIVVERYILATEVLGFATRLQICMIHQPTTTVLLIICSYPFSQSHAHQQGNIPSQIILTSTLA